MLSNFETLQIRPPARSNDERIAQLERTCKELRTYHIKAKSNKKPAVMQLILAYEFMLESIRMRLEKRSL